MWHRRSLRRRGRSPSTKSTNSSTSSSSSSATLADDAVSVAAISRISGRFNRARARRRRKRRFLNADANVHSKAIGVGGMSRSFCDADTQVDSTEVSIHVSEDDAANDEGANVGLIELLVLMLAEEADDEAEAGDSSDDENAEDGLGGGDQ